ncbi:MAG: alanine racemase [Candidatus Heimdallarchaeota archaeon]
MVIEQPTLFIDEVQVKKNIKKMVEKANMSKVTFRPHFKTHQSAIVGEWFKKFGVEKIAVSSIDMAEYFAKNGWNDISIAFPFNIRQIERVNKLAKKITLNLLVESLDVIEFLKENITSQINLWIKTDAGYHRTGIDWNDEGTLSKLIRIIKSAKNLLFEGLLVHSGHTYHTRSKDEIEEIYEDTILKLKNIQERLLLQGFSIVKLSIGDTPSCSIIDDFSGIDEIRPGNFVFYDITQLKLGSCTEDEIAVALACPIVALHPEREEITIYGGGIHLSKEHLQINENQKSFGSVALPAKNGWGKIQEKIYVKSISQEHGIVHAPKEFQKQIKIGDILYIIPIHSCMTANLMKRFYTTDGLEIKMMPVF